MTTKVTGFSPYYLLFRREPKIPVDEELRITFPRTKQKTVKQYVETLRSAYKGPIRPRAYCQRAYCSGCKLTQIIL